MPSLAINDVPPGVPGLSSGSAAQLAPVPSVAAARATGVPIVNLFRPAVQPVQPVSTVVPVPTALDRVLELGTRAKTGLQQLLGITPAAQPAQSVAVDNASAMEKQLDDLQKRSTTTVFQMRQKAATAGSSY